MQVGKPLAPESGHYLAGFIQVERIGCGAGRSMEAHTNHAARHLFFYGVQAGSHARAVYAPRSGHLEYCNLTIEHFVILAVLHLDFQRLGNPVFVICLERVGTVYHCFESLGLSFQICIGSDILEIYFFLIFFIGGQVNARWRLSR